MQIPKTIQQRMEDLVACFGGVPRGARKLEDYEARQHHDIWIQRMVGEGLACHYVVAYHLDHEWWTFCFDRRDESEHEGEDELWVVEGYDSSGRSWRDGFLYRAASGKWRRAPAALAQAGANERARNADY
jgi:hypothetical protein